MIIINIPHSSVKLAFEHLFVCPLEAATKEAYKLADLYTNEMVLDKPEYKKVVAPISRLVVDTERFVEDEDEPASKYGMGVIYTHDCSGNIIKQTPNQETRTELLGKYYYPHHELLESYTEEALSKYGKAIIIDLHSYPASYRIGLQTDKQPDICIGFDSFHYDETVYQKIVAFCKRNNWTYGINEPFAGSIVPIKYYQKDRNVISFMLEIKRSMYMDEQTYQKKAEFDHLYIELNKLLEDINISAIKG